MYAVHGQHWSSAQLTVVVKKKLSLVLETSYYCVAGTHWLCQGWFLFIFSSWEVFCYCDLIWQELEFVLCRDSSLRNVSDRLEPVSSTLLLCLKNIFKLLYHLVKAKIVQFVHELVWCTQIWGYAQRWFHNIIIHLPLFSSWTNKTFWNVSYCITLQH